MGGNMTDPHDSDATNNDNGDEVSPQLVEREADDRQIVRNQRTGKLDTVTTYDDGTVEREPYEHDEKSGPLT